MRSRVFAPLLQPLEITSVVRFYSITTVTVESHLAGTIYYHWYFDGQFVGMTTAPQRSFYLPGDDERDIQILDTNDPGFDSWANAPAGWPARRTIYWTRSLDSDVASYNVYQKEGAGAYSLIAIEHQDDRWEFSVLSPRLTDLITYQWKIVPVDAAGNEGTAIELDTETIVRTPDAPDFTITYDTGTDKVTFAAA